MVDWNEYVKLAIALVAIVDVPGNLPVFLQQTASMTPAQKRLASVSAGLATAAILLVFAFLGDAVLGIFGITLDAFKIVGGLVVLLIGLEMLGLVGSSEAAVAADRDAHPVAVGVFPLAVPMFAGPGAISVVMVYAHEEFHSSHDLIVSMLIATVSLAIIVGLSAAVAVSRMIGPITQRVLNRLLGMIVGALGVEFILEGLAGTFPALTLAP